MIAQLHLFSISPKIFRNLGGGSTFSPRMLWEQQCPKSWMESVWSVSDICGLPLWKQSATRAVQ